MIRFTYSTSNPSQVQLISISTFHSRLVTARSNLKRKPDPTILEITGLFTMVDARGDAHPATVELHSWLVPVLVAAVIIVASAVMWPLRQTASANGRAKAKESRKNLVVNYHFHRQCNYACKFCFHTAKTSRILDPETAKALLGKLKNHGMTRVQTCRAWLVYP